jgi:hypothetical protein
MNNAIVLVGFVGLLSFCYSLGKQIEEITNLLKEIGSDIKEIREDQDQER